MSNWQVFWVCISVVVASFSFSAGVWRIYDAAQCFSRATRDAIAACAEVEKLMRQMVAIQAVHFEFVNSKMAKDKPVSPAKKIKKVKK